MSNDLTSNIKNKYHNTQITSAASDAYFCLHYRLVGSLCL